MGAGRLYTISGNTFELNASFADFNSVYFIERFMYSVEYMTKH